jgi:4-hydroxybenzoate polyprenyltransferase
VIPAAASSGAAAARAPLRALLVSLRPAQWVKNAALLAAPVFAERLFHPPSLGLLVLALLAFCLLASATYLVNDVADRERDRAHAVKRRRPVAAGELSPAAAGAAAAVSATLGLVLAWAVGPGLLAVAAAYLALQGLYTAWLRDVVVIDVFAVAAGFVLRVVAGAVAVAVPVSNWLYLCTILLALFLALAKRRAEILLLEEGAERHRPILAEYTVPLLDQLVTVLSACTVLAYALYTLSAETIEKFGSDRLKYTVPFVLFGLFRYLHLVHRHMAGGEPERILFRDRATQLNLLGYTATVLWAVYGA